MWYDANTKKLYTIGFNSQSFAEGYRVADHSIPFYLDWIRQFTGDELCLTLVSQGKSAAIRNWPAGSLSILVGLLNLLCQVVIVCKNKPLKTLW